MPLKRSNKFNSDWLAYPKYKKWLDRHQSSELYAYCKLCKSDIHLESIRLGAVASHSKGKKHLRMIAQSTTTSIGNYFMTTSSDDKVSFIVLSISFIGY